MVSLYQKIRATGLWWASKSWIWSGTWIYTGQAAHVTCLLRCYFSLVWLLNSVLSLPLRPMCSHCHCVLWSKCVFPDLREHKPDLPHVFHWLIGAIKVFDLLGLWGIFFLPSEMIELPIIKAVPSWLLKLGRRLQWGRFAACQIPERDLEGWYIVSMR